VTKEIIKKIKKKKISLPDIFLKNLLIIFGSVSLNKQLRRLKQITVKIKVPP